MAQFTTRRRVEFSETDMAGIVHFANFYRWMEEAEHDFFRSLGLSIMVRQEDGSYIGWPPGLGLLQLSGTGNLRRRN